MASYKPGDPVWARPGTDQHGRRVLDREHPAIVLEVRERSEFPFLTDYCDSCKGRSLHLIDILPFYGICACRLRPRRDDYQQHEGLGSRDKLTNPLADEVVAKELLDAIGSTLAGV